MRILPAPDEAQRLHDEFDFADAAAAEFDVAAEQPVGLVARIDLALHVMDVADGREIQVFAPDEGADGGEETRAQCEVARDRPGLGESGALPGAAMALVIAERGRQGDDRRGGAGVRAQPQIDAENIAIRVAMREQSHQVARKTRHHGLRFGGIDGSLGIEEQDEVDIGRVIQFPGAELAQSQGDKAEIALGFVGMRERDLAGLVQAEQQMADRDSAGGFGQFGQGGGDLRQRPGAAEIGERRW